MTETQRTLSCKGFSFPNLSFSKENVFEDSFKYTSKDLASRARSLVNKATSGGVLEPETELKHPTGYTVSFEDISKEPTEESNNFGVSIVLTCSIVSGTAIDFTEHELRQDPAIPQQRYLKYSLKYAFEGYDVSSIATNYALFNEGMKSPIFDSLRGHFIDSPLLDPETQKTVMRSSEGTSLKEGNIARVLNIAENDYMLNGLMTSNFEQFTEKLGGEKKVYRGDYAGRALDLNTGFGGGPVGRDYEYSEYPYYRDHIDIRIGIDGSKYVGFEPTRSVDLSLYLMMLETTVRCSQLLLKVEDYLMKKFTS